MQKKLAVRSAKLSSETQKIKSANNVSIAYEHQSRDPEERHHGILFGILSVSGSPKKSEELIELILDTFHGEYFQDLAKNPLESFESSLSKINEELAEYTNSGNTFWMGKMSAVIGVIANNTIHLTQIGKAEAFLYRGGKQSHITTELTGDALNPARTFVNVASGEATDGDKIVVVSPGVLSSCSPEEIGKFVIDYHPKIAVNHIADIIQGVGGSKGQNALIVMEVLTPEALANETLEDEPEEIWLESASKKEVLADTAGGFLQKLIRIFALVYVAITGFINSKILPALKKAVGSGKARYTQRKSTRKDKNSEKGDIFIETVEEIDTGGKVRYEDHQQLPLDELKTPSYKSEIRIKESDEFPKMAKFENAKTKVSDKINGLLDFIFSLRKVGSRKKPFLRIKRNYLILAVVILVGISVPYGLYVKSNKKEAQLKDSEKARIESLISQISGVDSMIATNPTEAITTLDRLKTEANELTKSKYFADEAKKQVSAIDTKIATATKTTNVDLDTFTEIANSSSPLVGMYPIDAFYYAINQGGDIYKIDIKTQKSTQIQTNGKVSGKVTSATAVTKIKTIEILTDAKKVYEFDTESNSLEEKTASDGWNGQTKIDSYGTNIYLLEEAGQIYRHTRTSSGYSKGLAYLSESDIKPSTSFTIDSDIYLLTKDGVVSKYTAGEKVDFQIKNMPISISGAEIIYTYIDSKYLLVASHKDKSIVALDKEGNYIGRFANKDFENLQNVYMENNTIYAALNKKIVTFEIK